MRRKPGHIRRTLRLSSPDKSASSAHWFWIGDHLRGPISRPTCHTEQTSSGNSIFEMWCAARHVNIDVRLRRVIILHHDAPPCLLSYNDQAEAEVDQAVESESKGIE